MVAWIILSRSGAGIRTGPWRISERPKIEPLDVVYLSADCRFGSEPDGATVCPCFLIRDWSLLATFRTRPEVVVVHRTRCSAQRSLSPRNFRYAGRYEISLVYDTARPRRNGERQFRRGTAKIFLWHAGSDNLGENLVEHLARRIRPSNCRLIPL